MQTGFSGDGTAYSGFARKIRCVRDARGGEAFEMWYEGIGNEYIVLTVIAVSTFISLVYLLIAVIIRQPQRCISGFIMIFCPVAGPLFFFFTFIIEKFRRKDREYEIDDIGFSKEKRGRMQAPDYEEEIQSVPLEEVLLVSRHKDRRKYLLRELKKDDLENYSTLIKALDNDDPETTHYAASAISAAKARFENNIRELDSRYRNSQGPVDTDLVRSYTDYVLSYLHSGILDEMETRKYNYLFISLINDIEDPESFLTEQDYVNMVDKLIRVEDYVKAGEWAERAIEKKGGEFSFLLLAKVYYYTNESDKLKEIIDRLKKSDLPLSNKGLELVRFFMSKS